MHGAKNTDSNVYCTLLVCTILGGITQTQSWMSVMCMYCPHPSFPSSCIYETTALDV